MSGADRPISERMEHRDFQAWSAAVIAGAAACSSVISHARSGSNVARRSVRSSAIAVLLRALLLSLVLALLRFVLPFLFLILRFQGFVLIVCGGVPNRDIAVELRGCRPFSRRGCNEVFQFRYRSGTASSTKAASAAPPRIPVSSSPYLQCSTEPLGIFPTEVIGCLKSANDAPTASVPGTASRVLLGAASMILDRFSIFAATGPNVSHVLCDADRFVRSSCRPTAALIVSEPRGFQPSRAGSSDSRQFA